MSSEEPLQPSDVPPTPTSRPADQPASASQPAVRPATPASPVTPAPPGQRNAADGTRTTRAAVIWSAVAVSLVVLVLLIIFFIQNQDMVAVRFLVWEGSLSQGVAFFIAAVGGGILVAIAGGARILQLRHNERRRRKGTDA
ncbi:lipopolysaccharide assembly protein LapA domain-containing protein [Pseudarthrobacter sp. H3Y2-7]|uniref:LapA family protein n=1 Tax=Pseudarthrobacter naphthalenicus TaxID=3031328 RepID=UPI0023AF3DD8|nr:lipopolysaccharide assembly protein LapA domain-containing protein [Pseudarthrobacter sp. H3Y2-7]MDE8668102.1 lipopolysaccharide assembly protein LapA domain-containing protein [Pseudarthrobacter sp. H3Y2-7]